MSFSEHTMKVAAQIRTQGPDIPNISYNLPPPMPIKNEGSPESSLSVFNDKISHYYKNI
jgi:hypothetical protein